MSKITNTPLLYSFISCFLFLFCSLFFLINKKLQRSYKTNHILGIFFLIFIFLFGVFYSDYIERNNSPKYIQHASYNTIYEGKVIENLTKKTKSYETLLSINKLYNGKKETKTKGNIICYFSKEDSNKLPKIGDVIIFKSNFNDIEPPRLPKQFNYKEYQKSKGVFHSVFLNSNKYKIVRNENSLYIISQKIRNYLIEKFKQSKLNKEQLSVISAIFLGEKKLLDKETKSNFTDIGAMHVLAVSGLHVGIILYILTYVLDKILGENRNIRTKAVIIITLIWFFAFITGLSISVIRAATMFSLVALSKIIIEKSNIYNTIFASMFFILLLNPYYLFDVGFQLSYIAVFGIIYFYPYIYNMFFVKNKLLNHIWSITAVSISAQITTIPLSIYYFNQIPLLSLISNLFVTYFAVIIIAISIIMVCVLPFIFIFNFVSTILSFITYLLLDIVTKVSSIPNNKISNIYITNIEFLLIFIALTFVILSIEYKKNKYLKHSLIVVLIISISINYNYYKKSNVSQISFYNTKHITSFNLITQDKNILFISDTVKKDNISNALQKHWGKLSKSNVEFVKLSTNYNEIIRINDLKILNLNKEKLRNVNEWFDFVIINNRKLNISNISLYVKSSNYILGNKIYKNKIKTIINQNRIDSLNIVSIRENPSFNIQL